MGECYNPYPKLPKNIRQIGERDPVLKLYVEDYVNTYLRRLYPTGGQDLRVGLLLGENREEDEVPYLFVDGALQIERASIGGDGSSLDGFSAVLPERCSARSTIGNSMGRISPERIS